MSHNGGVERKPNSFINPPNFALPSFSYFFILRVFLPLISAQALRGTSPLCPYFRPKCVNLPKSLRFYKLFS